MKPRTPPVPSAETVQAAQQGDVRAIVTLLGGQLKAAELTDSTERSVRAWCEHGIPWKHHLTIIEAARERGVELTSAALIATRDRARARAA